jgi:hypothetical protein
VVGVNLKAVLWAVAGAAKRCIISHAADAVGSASNF